MRAGLVIILFYLFAKPRMVSYYLQLTTTISGEGAGGGVLA